MDMDSSQKSAHQIHDFETGHGNGFPEDQAFYDRKKTNADDRRDMMRMNKPQEMRVRPASSIDCKSHSEQVLRSETSKQ